MSKKRWLKPADFGEPTEHLTKSLKLSVSAETSISAISSISPKIKNPPQLLTMTSNGENSSSFMESFAPKTIADLAVHAKKIEEIQEWFKSYEDSENKLSPILLITGPSGSGKYTAAKTIANELSYDVCEWTNPCDNDLYQNDKYDFENIHQNTFRENQKDAFNKFLYKSSRYTSLFASNEKRVLIVKDYPNNFLRDPELFFSSIKHYSEVGGCPLIFLATETSNKKVDIIYNLFPQNILIENEICHINLNSVSQTLLKKAMKRLTTIMQQESKSKYYKIPTQEILDSIMLSSQGDLRNISINLYYASLKNASTVELVPKNAAELSSKTKLRGSKLKSIGCDENLTLMHALGRVFNPKYQLNERKEPQFVHSPEEICENFSSQAQQFISLIHSNYVDRFYDIDDIVGAADTLSFADVMMKEYREDVMFAHSLNIAIRGTMVHNKKPQTGWKPIRPKKVYNKPNLQNHETQLKYFDLQQSSISSEKFISDYKQYVGIIRSAALKRITY